jgi:hypothetical protein
VIQNPAQIRKILNHLVRAGRAPPGLDPLLGLLGGSSLGKVRSPTRAAVLIKLHPAPLQRPMSGILPCKRQRYHSSASQALRGTPAAPVS